MQAHSVGSCSVLAVLHCLSVVTFQLAAGKGTQMFCWKWCDTLQFGIMSKRRDSKLWKRCKCECNGRIKCVFYIIGRQIIPVLFADSALSGAEIHYFVN